jgi:CBS domain-containing protein
MTAKEIMTEKVLTVKENDDVSKVAKIMLDKHIKRLPVMDGDKLAGIVSRSDIVKMLL